jgi:hypothetical protein
MEKLEYYIPYVSCSIFAYIYVVVKPREKSQFDQMVSQGMQQLISERQQKDKQQEDQLKKH